MIDEGRYHKWVWMSIELIGDHKFVSGSVSKMDFIGIIINVVYIGIEDSSEVCNARIHILECVGYINFRFVHHTAEIHYFVLLCSFYPFIRTNAMDIISPTHVRHIRMTM